MVSAFHYSHSSEEPVFLSECLLMSKERYAVPMQKSLNAPGGATDFHLEILRLNCPGHLLGDKDNQEQDGKNLEDRGGTSLGSSEIVLRQ